MKKVLVMLAAIALFSCNRKIPSNKPVNIEHDSPNIIESTNKLPTAYYLEQRVNDCEQSLDFMKAIIVPDTINTGFGFSVESQKYSRLGFIRIGIIGHSNTTELATLHKLFIDLSCLKELEPIELFEILCTGSDLKALQNEFSNKVNYSQRYIFEVIIDNIFGFNIILKENSIINMQWFKKEVNH